ncbi:aspartate aminotransferase family protein [Streptomyces angustmyceticus]|uniref:aspartate aminotransferase family protein n=1 Tax=Streptomyces angustmyceticus TaxID=285578 RepID=UPI00381D76B3
MTSPPARPRGHTTPPAPAAERRPAPPSGAAHDRSPEETKAAVTARYRAHLSPARATLGELFGGLVESGSSGAWVFTTNGRSLLNCGGYGVLLMGARHPRVVRAVTEQIATHPVATRMLLEPRAGAAAEALAAVTPPGLDHVHFAGSGAEAVEAALKLARCHGRTTVVAAHGGYHGKTMGALSATGNPMYRGPFLPLLPGVRHLPYGDAAALEQELAQAPADTACVIVEPVQAEAGVLLPPPGYLSEVAASCRAHGALLVLDEVQTGLGRLGSWWGADREGVVPDILLVGKALSGGVIPVSAMVASREVFQPFGSDPFVHTSTFSAAPVAMAAAEAAIACIREEDLVSRAKALGSHLLPRIRQIAAERLGDLLVEVRGAGLLIGVELAEPGLTAELLLELLSRGVLANHSLNSHAVLRFTPPAVLTDRDVDILLTTFEHACTALAESRRNAWKEENRPCAVPS